MARPLRTTIQNGQQGWDADVNDNFITTFDNPFPIAQHAGDETDLQSTFAAAQYDRCFIWVDHTVRGWTLYYSDGTSWLQFGGAIQVRSASSASIAMTAADDLLIVTGTGSTVTLPAAANAAGKVFYVKNETSGTVTIDPNGSETIDGSLTYSSIVNHETISFVSDGTAWFII